MFRALDPKTVDNLLLASDIPSSGTEGLRERAHEDIDITRVDTEVVRDPTTARAHGNNRVSLVDEEVEL